MKTHFLSFFAKIEIHFKSCHRLFWRNTFFAILFGLNWFWNHFWWFNLSRFFRILHFSKHHGLFYDFFDGLSFWQICFRIYQIRHSISFRIFIFWTFGGIFFCKFYCIFLFSNFSEHRWLLNHLRNSPIPKIDEFEWAIWTAILQRRKLRLARLSYLLAQKFRWF